MDSASRRQFYNALNPELPAGEADKLYVDLDGFGDDYTRPRGGQWLELLASAIEYANAPVCHFFTGLPGSGKSTVLRRLRQRLERDGERTRLAVMVDTDELLDLRRPIEIPDVMAAILLQVESELLDREGRPIGEALRTGFLGWLSGWVWGERIELSRFEANLGLPVGKTGVQLGLKLAGELKARDDLRAALHKRVKESPRQFMEGVEREALRLVERAQAIDCDEIVAIVDSLEKLSGVTLNFGEVLDSAERLFANGAKDLRLPFHVIYTVPTPLLFRVREVQVEFLPLLKVRDQEGRPSAEGVKAARALVERRMPAAAIEALLGPRWEPLLHEIIAETGGYPREMLRRMQRLVRESTWPVSDPNRVRIAKMAEADVRQVVSDDAVTLLARVALDKRLAPSEAERAVADKLLRSNVVMMYQNQHRWWDVHPGLRQDRAIEQAVQKLRGLVA